MGIIDFRVRPIYKHYEKFSDGAISLFMKMYGYEKSESMNERTVESLLKELEEEGIEKAVIPGRGAYGTTNEELFELLDIAPDKFIIFPFLDAANTEEALEIIDKQIINGRGQGASMEPGGGNDYKFDDERNEAIFAKLEENNIPLMTTVSGWVGPHIDNTIPAQIDRLLTRHPKLKYIAAHAGWPWLNEMVALTFKHRNLYLTADFDGTRGVGADILRQGALYMATDNVIFASSYPLGPIGQGIQSVRDWKLPADIEKKVLHDTAASILGIE